MVLQGSNHTTRPMARFAFRVTTASALSLAILTAVPPVPSTAQAQETERPFDCSTASSAAASASAAGANGAPPPPRTRPRRCRAPIWWCGSSASRARSGSSPARSSSFSSATSSSRRRSVACRRGRDQWRTAASVQSVRAVGSGCNDRARTARRRLRSRAESVGARCAAYARRGQRTGQPAARGRRSERPVDRCSGRTRGQCAARSCQYGPPGGATPGQPPRGAAAGVPATLPPSQTPRDEYDLAYGYVLRKDYALAEDGFRNFLSKYPDDRPAGDATFWLGESQFQRQRYRDAAEAFLNVSTKYESNAKAPDALLRLGQLLAVLGEKEAACASLGRCCANFRAPASVKQGVEREQKRARC